MLAESRVDSRENIQLEEIIGRFHLDAGERHFDNTFVNDVSVSGAGIELDAPLEVGSSIDLTFVAGDWNVCVQGQVVWCCMERDKQTPVKTDDHYRVGVKFNPRNTNNNVIFFMASRSMVRPAV